MRLAKDVGLTSTAIRKRIERLLRERHKEVYCRHRAEEDRIQRPAILGVDAAPDALLRIAAELAKRGEMKKVFAASGEHSIIAEAWARDYGELKKLMEEVRPLKGVRRVALSLVRSAYWGD